MSIWEAGIDEGGWAREMMAARSEAVERLRAERVMGEGGEDGEVAASARTASREETRAMVVVS